MTLTYNGTEYTVTEGSMYLDFSIAADTLESACEIVEALAGMTEYTFYGTTHSNMVVTRRAIIITDNIRVNVRLREKSEKEIMAEELQTLRTAMQELAQTTNKTTTAKINMILEKGVTV